MDPEVIEFKNDQEDMLNQLETEKLPSPIKSK